MKLPKILIINGPNLNLLGKREPDIYGKEGFETLLKRLRSKYTDIDIEYFQSNHEGALIDTLHRVGFDASYLGIVLNAGAYTHTSIAIADAMAAIQTDVLEVHISNVYQRESFRHKSYLAPNACGCIIGLGLKGYELGVQYFLDR